MTDKHIIEDEFRWRVHTPALLKEIMNNPGTAMLAKPLQIFANKLFEVAEAAARVNDPELNRLMLELTLYEIADAYEHPDQKEYRAAMVTIKQQLKNREQADDLVYLRDLDGTGSMHVCSKGDTGAVEYAPTGRVS